MPNLISRRVATWSVLAASLVSAALLVQACGDEGLPAAAFPPEPDASDAYTYEPDAAFNGDGGIAQGDIAIFPANPTVDVAIDDGVITTAPITFTAQNANNVGIAASFTLDRGELGNLVAASGVFTASGASSGKGTVTASFGGKTASTTLTVRVAITQNGPPKNYNGGNGAGGYGGVGGAGPGKAVSATTKNKLLGAATPPANAQQLGFLYPYDKTVWPRGVLPPLLQWQTSLAITAVRVHVEQANFKFDGFYGGTALVNQPVDPYAWSKALYGNGGDPMKVDVYAYDGSKLVGPISESYGVAPGTLKGTVYYNSYNSKLNANGATTGAVLAIKPGAFSPTLALPSQQGKCHVCHEVSANGSTLFTQISSSLVDNAIYYAPNASFDMTKGGKQIADYAGTAPDGSSNDRKFLWSGVYPDGTFALVNSKHARENNKLSAGLFGRKDGSKISSTGIEGVVTAAVTPTFSTSGKAAAFNFWEGPGAGNVTAGAGHSLAMMDFDCGQGNGITCGAPPYHFSKLRELYRDSARFPAWPTFTPDAKGLVFHNTVTPGSCKVDCEISTWFGAQAELWYTGTTAPNTPVRMNALNGLTSGNVPYVPSNVDHPSDAKLNYEPTVNPVASGGYYWVVFTARRMYGNIATGAPYDNGDGTYPIAKKLWVAAIDVNPKAGQDPSHPAFYLPGQELDAGNMRGFWVVDPCQPNGNSCQTGDECCNGFCRQAGDGGGLVCTDQPPGCAEEFENCTTDADCCGSGAGIACIGGRCSRMSPN